MKFQMAGIAVLAFLTYATGNEGSLRGKYRRTSNVYDCISDGGTIIDVDFEDFDGGAWISHVTDFLKVTAYKHPDGGDYFTPICDGGDLTSGCNLVNNAGGGFARIFNSSNPTGGDLDLGSPNESCDGCTPERCPGKGSGGAKDQVGANCNALGNLLIVTEFEGPPDDADGAQLRFEFTDLQNSYQFLSVGILDVEEMTMTLTFLNGETLSEDKQYCLSDNAFQVVTNAAPQKVLKGFDLDFKGSGAVSNLKFCKKTAMPASLPSVVDVEKLVRVEKEPFSGSPTPNGNDDDADELTGPKACIGDRVVFTSMVTNSGSVAICNITVNTSDDLQVDHDPNLFFGDNNNNGCLEPSETWIYVQSKIVESTDLGTQFKGTDTVRGIYLGDGGRTVIDSDDVHYLAECPLTPSPTSSPVEQIPLEILIDKVVHVEKEPLPGSPAPNENDDDADAPTGPKACVGDRVVFTSIITNPSSVTLCNITVTTSDDLQVDKDPTFHSGDINNNGCLDSDETWIYVQSKTVEFTDLGTQFNGTDTVQGTYLVDGRTIIDSDDVHYLAKCPLTPSPTPSPTEPIPLEIVIDKVVRVEKQPLPGGPAPNGNDDDADEPTGPKACVGDRVVFTSIVTNPSSVALCNITVTTSDNLQVDKDPTFHSGDLNNNGCLDSNETWVYVQSKTVEFTDLGTQFKGTDTVQGIYLVDGRTVIDSDDVHYFGECPLTPSPTYSPTEPVPLEIIIEKRVRVETEPSKNPIPNGIDDDANEATGPKACVGDQVVFTSIVRNPSSVTLCNITLITSDDLKVDRNPSFFIGDENTNGCLEPMEIWVYVQSKIVELTDLGTQFKGTDTVQGIYLVDGRTVTDSDDVHYLGECPPTPPPTSSPTSSPTEPEPLKIDIEKLVHVEKQQTTGTGDVCEINDKPRSLTFEYQPFNNITNLQEGKAEFKIRKPLDDDCSAFAMMGEEPDPKKMVEELQKFESGERSSLDKVYGYESLSCGDVFEAKRSNGGDFPGTTYLYFFTSKPTLNNWETLIFQQVKIESGCGKPLNFGDRFGSGKLICYRGKNDDAAAEFCLPKPLSPIPNTSDDDADEPTGPEACPGDMVVFTSIVTNPSTVPLCDIQVTTSADLNVDEDPTYVSGDENGDGCLDPDETWIYVQSKIVEASDFDSQVVGADTVIGTYLPDGRTATDSDIVHYFGKCPLPPLPTNGLCDVCGKPTMMTWTYIPSNTHATFQGSKSVLSGQADDDYESFVVVADQRDVVKLQGSSPAANIYFRGALISGDTFGMKPNYLELSSGQDPDKFDNDVIFMVFDSEASFNNRAAPLQIGYYHASCSAPIVPGAVLGSFVLGTPYEGENNCAYPSFPWNT